MTPEFWHRRWQKRQIGFHQADGNPLLKTHFDSLALTQKARVFVPLCGKSRDISWLLSKGCHVIAAELSEVAVKALFTELGITPKIVQLDKLKRYSDDNLSVFVGDIFDVTQAHIGNVDAVYDRAAMVALPKTMRGDYAQHITQITQHAKQLLICLTYDQAQMEGPPFSISDDELAAHYAQKFNLMLLNKQGDAFAGGVQVQHKAWLISPKA